MGRSVQKQKLYKPCIHRTSFHASWMFCVIVGTYTVTTDCTETLRALAKVSLPYQVTANIQGTREEEQSGEGHFVVKWCQLLSGPFMSKAACNRNDLRNASTVRWFLDGMNCDQILDLWKLKVTRKVFCTINRVRAMSPECIELLGPKPAVIRITVSQGNTDVIVR